MSASQRYEFEVTSTLLKDVDRIESEVFSRFYDSEIKVCSVAMRMQRETNAEWQCHKTGKNGTRLSGAFVESRTSYALESLLVGLLDDEDMAEFNARITAVSDTGETMRSLSMACRKAASGFVIRMTYYNIDNEYPSHLSSEIDGPLKDWALTLMEALS